MKNAWRYGTVDRDSEHFVLSHGPSGEPFDIGMACAFVGRAADGTFLVEPSSNSIDEGVMAALEKDLEFYIVEKGEPFPWDYMQYHTTTMANMYSNIKWAFAPDGQRSYARDATGSDE